MTPFLSSIVYALVVAIVVPFCSSLAAQSSEECLEKLGRSCSVSADCDDDWSMCVGGSCCTGCVLWHRNKGQLSFAADNCETDGIKWRAKQCNEEGCFCAGPHGAVQPDREADDCAGVSKRNLAGSWCAVAKRGHCPQSTFGGAPSHRCTCDSDCAGQLKCCVVSATFTKSCMQPKPEVSDMNAQQADKPGFCPVNNGGSIGGARQCFNDRDCDRFGQHFKCCASRFGMSCTPPSDDQRCSSSKNEVAVVCNDPCQPHCNDLNRLPCPPVSCQPGCKCRVGFVRRDSNPFAECILQSACNECGALKYFSECVRCPVGCDNVDSPPTTCTATCQRGCTCQAPYIVESSRVWLTSSESITNTVPSSRFRCVLATACPRSTPTCSDPRKVPLRCGTRCPAGCNQLNPRPCAGACVNGCFCRDPYILQDADDVDSACVLREQCRRCPQDPNKQWGECGSRCPPACDSPRPSCGGGGCVRGCFCRRGYVLERAADPRSACVLQRSCPATPPTCPDASKVPSQCVAACPVGCDNLTPRNCGPCQPGCDCAAGYVFENSAAWRTSRCVTRAQCDQFTTRPGLCPSTSIDQLGAACEFDGQCPATLKCCRRTGAAKRCTCPGPFELFQATVNNCQPYCGQPTPTCSGVRRGCGCGSGYVRESSQTSAQCIRASSCPTGGTGTGTPTGSVQTASAQLTGRFSRVSGTLLLRREGGGLRISGTIRGLSLAEHGLAVHALGVSGDCDSIGAHFNPDGAAHGGPTDARRHAGDLGNVNRGGRVSVVSERISFDGRASVLGRSIAIHARRDDGGRGSVAQSRVDGNMGAPLACATIVVTG